MSDARRSGWSGQWIVVAACLTMALYLLTFPLQDFDTFWHLAYGRAMVESGAFINHEIFSYTAAGKDLASHSQLAQIILYAVWAVGGANALLTFKLIIATLVFALIVATARLFGAGTVAGAVLALMALVVGIGRVVERPELFSILLQALLIWLLFRARHGRYLGRELWALPPLMVVWDYLHGALYGLVIMIAFVAAESARIKLLPRLTRGQGGGEDSDGGLNRLLAWGGITVAAMFLHPNGLLAYGSFWRVGSNAEFRMYGEFMAPTSAQFVPYWIFLALALALILWRLRACDLTTLAVLLPFLAMSLMYNRAVLAFCLAAIPALSQVLAVLRKGDALLFRHRTATALGLAALLASVLAYKQFWVINEFRFGTGLSANVFPVGSARFVRERGLTGNMYNMNGYGGYLAFFLAPEQKIFHYNQPGVFTALFDFLHKPASRREWPIDYAIVGDTLEYNMFNREGFVTIYQEPTAAVMVPPGGANAALVDRYRIRAFAPLMTDEKLVARANHPATARRLLVEMADYLTFREDRRIAELFVGLLRQSPTLFNETERAALLESLRRYNAASLP